MLRGAVLLVSEGHLHHAAERPRAHRHGGGVVACGEWEGGRMIVLINHRVKARLRSDENIVLPVCQLQRQPLCTADIGEFSGVRAVRLSIEVGGGKREAWRAVGY